MVTGLALCLCAETLSAATAFATPLASSFPANIVANKRVLSDAVVDEVAIVILSGKPVDPATEVEAAEATGLSEFAAFLHLTFNQNVSAS